MAGVNFISVIIGLFALGEVFVNVEQKIALIVDKKKIDWMPTWADINRCWGAMLRSTGVGFFMGLLPGCAPAVTTFVAYDLEKRVSKHPEQFGHGAIEGVAAPEGSKQRDVQRGLRSAIRVWPTNRTRPGSTSGRIHDVRTSARPAAVPTAT